MPRKRYITVKGVTKSVAGWAEHTKISKAQITTRLHRGWSEADAVLTPNLKNASKGVGMDNSNYKHGGATNGVCREYYIWSDMKRRCHNPNHTRYYLYGARGVSVCKEWQQSFLAWFNYIGPRPSSKHSQDRIDNNGNYEPGNVRWATTKEQQLNKRNTRWLTANGRTQPLQVWADELGCPVSSLHWRLSNGYSEERAINTPFRKPGLRVCDLDGCEQKHYADGRCRRHRIRR